MQFSVHQLIYFCHDMTKMYAFYTDVMGLVPEPGSAPPEEGWVRLNTDGFALCLHKTGKGSSKGADNKKLVFQVDDVAAARAYLIGHGVKMGVHHHWGTMDASDGHDPEGNKFQIAGPPTPGE
jgi:catechol 2,3-dioxygenase-like lactoylglutathione lyase family enzyme